MGARGGGAAARLASGQVFAAGRAKRVRAGESGGDNSSSRLSGAHRAARSDGEAWWTYTLTERRAVALDTFFFRFAPPPGGGASVAAGQHVWFLAYPGLRRQYTPVAVGASGSGDARPGAGAGASLDFIIKVYRQALGAGGAGGYGRMTQHLAQLPIGSTLEMSAPAGRLRYFGKGGALAIAPSVGGSGRGAVRAKVWQHWGMVAGGTGITPMLVLLRALFAEPRDECDVTVSLVAAFRTESAVLARKELEALAAAQPDRFALHLVVSEPSPGWGGGGAAEPGRGGGAGAGVSCLAACVQPPPPPQRGAARHWSGRVGAEVLRAAMPSPSATGGALALLCGPDGMVESGCLPHLRAAGWSAGQTFVF
jgi:cytochrome-b5 reductase